MDALDRGATFRFPQVLSDLINALNTTASRAIGGVSPKELIDNSPGAVEQMRRRTKPSMFWSAKKRRSFFQKVNRHIIAEPGQYVRITTSRSTFEKLSQRKHSKLEMFKVRKVRFPVPADGTHYSMYQLEDSDGELIAGLFRTSEIIPVAAHFSPSNPAFRFHIVQWEEMAAGAAGSNRMIWVQYAGMYMGGREEVPIQTRLEKKRRRRRSRRSKAG